MSELFKQNYSDKPLFHTDTDISESLHNQVDEASNGEELLDNTEKQAESLLSNDDYVSETKNSISDDRDDVAESLSSPAEGNRKYITGTNTPRASRSNAYYELLCNQQTNGHRSPAMRGTTAAAHGITSVSGLVSYQEDFATDAAQDLGVHGAAAELIMQETFLGTAAEDVGILGSYTVKGIKDVQDGTRTAEEVLHTGGDVLRMELGLLRYTSALPVHVPLCTMQRPSRLVRMILLTVRRVSSVIQAFRPVIALSAWHGSLPILSKRLLLSAGWRLFVAQLFCCC